MLHIRGMWVWFKLVLDCDGQPLTSVLLWRIWVVLVTTHFLIGVWELQFVTCESSRLLSQSSTVLTEALPFSWRWRFNQAKAKPIYLIDLDTSAQYDRKRKSRKFVVIFVSYFDVTDVNALLLLPKYKIFAKKYSFSSKSPWIIHPWGISSNLSIFLTIFF